MVRRRNPGARTWLDLCCGVGRLLHLAAKAGYSVTGVDASPDQLWHARRNTPRARLVRADISRLALGRKYDVITCMFDSINYLPEREAWMAALRRAARHLAPGGVFIFDVNTAYSHSRYWRRTNFVRDPRCFVALDNSYDSREGEARARVTGFRLAGGRWRRFDELHIQRSWPDAVLDRMVRDAGMSFRKYGNPPFTPPRRSSGRKFYVCSLPRAR
jgi:SAM-dependent methyltransferase